MDQEARAILGRLNDAAIRSTLAYLNDTYSTKVSFFQIGGNDGKRGDPVNSLCKRFSWQGVIAEPVPEYFERLSREYQDSPRVHCENVAISDQPSSLDIFFVPFDRVPQDRPWEQGLASLSRQHLLDNNVAAERISKVTVPVCTAEEILAKYKGLFLHLVVLDVEGHEETIIKSFPWEQTLPECLVFESKHLSNDAHQSVTEFVKKFGYTSFRLLSDTIALRNCPTWLHIHLSDLQRISR